MSKVTEALILSLNAEFGRKPREKKSQNEIVRDLNKASYTNTLDHRSSNAIARDPRFTDSWKPEAREIWTTKQRCSCCLKETEFVSGEYTRFRNSRLHVTVQRRQDFVEDGFRFNSSLPQEVILIVQDVARCPSCIRSEQLLDDLLSITQAVLEKKLPQSEQLIIPGLEEK
jgi:hypothetical protein